MWHISPPPMIGHVRQRMRSDRYTYWKRDNIESFITQEWITVRRSKLVCRLDIWRFVRVTPSRSLRQDQGHKVTWRGSAKYCILYCKRYPI